MTSIRDIARLSKVQIESKTKAELTVFAKTLGLRGYSKLKKGELAALVFGASDIERKAIINSNRQANIAKQAIDMFEGTSDYPRLLDLWYKAYSKDTEEAANQISSYFEKFIDSNEKKVVSVINNDYNEVRNLLKDWFSTDQDDWARSVLSKLHEKTAELRQKVTANYTVRKDSKERLTDFDYSSLLDEAKNILENTNDFGWEWISFALALTSGRRATEIHGEDREYSVGNNLLTISERDGVHLLAEYQYEPTLAFKGAAKVKSRNVDTIQIPTLVDANTWLKAWNELPAERKGCSSKRMKSISRALSEKLKQPLAIRGLKMYKDSRDVYTDIVLDKYDESNFTAIHKDSKGKTLDSNDLKDLFASTILNHKIEAGATRSYGSK